MQPKAGWLLPREGFHGDHLGSIIRQTLLNPTLLLPLLAFSQYTDRGRDFTTRYTRALPWVKTFGVLSVLRVVNNLLNRRALSNGVRDTYDWNKEIVLVTGGADGIGARLVQQLAERNITVVVLDVQPLSYPATPTVHYFACDITSTSAIETAASQIRSTVGKPTVLVNNAGVCRGKSLLNVTDRDLELTFGVNTIAHYKLVRAFVPDMIAANHGMIVTVASVAAWVTASHMTEYAASKAASLAFHEGLSTELVTTHNAPRVRTVMVNQSYTRTSLFQGFGIKDSTFFGPPLYVDTLVDEMVAQILRGESGQIIMPGWYKIVGAHLRSFPHWMQIRVRQDTADIMKNWTGTQIDVQANKTG